MSSAPTPTGPSLASLAKVPSPRDRLRLPVRACRPGALALIALLVAACFTPSIPIPPPEASAITFAVDASAGVASVRYPPSERYADALVYVFNRTQGRGIIEVARPDGSIGPTAPFPAVINDQVSITIEADEQAASICVVVREGTPTQYCPDF
jgi:hypothetical protein